VKFLWPMARLRYFASLKLKLLLDFSIHFQEVLFLLSDAVIRRAMIHLYHREEALFLAGLPIRQSDCCPVNKYK